MLSSTKGLSPQTIYACVGYMTCSSLMLIMNKLAVHFLPAPSFVLMGQLTMSAAAVWVAGKLGYIQVDALERQKAFRFSFVAVAFLSLIFANIKTLQYANVETFVVFRASTPLAISLADYYLLGREMPSVRSWLCLVVLLLGAVAYVLTDEGFHISGYYWVAVWYLLFCFDQIYIKHVVDTVKMESNWGNVCKFLTIFINYFMWEHHANLPGFSL